MVLMIHCSLLNILSRECLIFILSVDSSYEDIKAASHQVNGVVSVLLNLKAYLEELRSYSELGGHNGEVPGAINHAIYSSKMW
jgi:hypothetical protein